jgi:hypothetical protein
MIEEITALLHELRLRLWLGVIDTLIELGGFGSWIYWWALEHAQAAYWRL